MRTFINKGLVVMSTLGINIHPPTRMIDRYILAYVCWAKGWIKKKESNYFLVAQ